MNSLKTEPIVENGGAVVVLLSGGADSAVMTALALRTRPVFPLYVRQGALWEDAEEAAIRRFLGAINPSGFTPLPAKAGTPKQNQLAPLRVARVDLPEGYASHWALEPGADFPDGESPDYAVYLPGRNLALLLQGALLAQSIGARVIQIGLLAGNPFPDSRTEFFESFSKTYELATGFWVEIEAPLRGMNKAEVLRLGADLPLDLTFSCLRPAEVKHCGKCNKCAERKRGFEQAGLVDPTEYLI